MYGLRLIECKPLQSGIDLNDCIGLFPPGACNFATKC